MIQSSWGHSSHDHSGFMSGFFHPVTGWDHLLAIFAVGLWAYQLGGRSLWIAPVIFVLAMGTGACLGMEGIEIPLVEEGILVSIFILGLLVAFGARFPDLVCYFIVAFFAFFHGHAHGAESHSSSSGFLFVIGFSMMTALLHLAGILVARGVHKTQSLHHVRYAGYAVIGLGFVCMLFF